MYKQSLRNCLSCFLQLEEIHSSKLKKLCIICSVCILFSLPLRQALSATGQAIHQKEQEVARLRTRQLDCQTLKKSPMGLPWWHNGWESACQCRGHGFEPWSGKIPHAAEQLGPCTTTTEPSRHKYWSPCAWSPCSATGEAAAVRGPRTEVRSSPCSPQLERAQAQQQRPNAAKN